jgi:putative transposase
MLAIEVDTSLAALRVVRVLERLRLTRGFPERIIIDHGTEFTPRPWISGPMSTKSRCISSRPATQWRTVISRAFMASHNQHWFMTSEDPREIIECWRIDSNRVRPHSALGYMSPPEFAGNLGYAVVETAPASHNHTAPAAAGRSHC